MGELIGGLIVFVFLVWITGKALKLFFELLGKAITNIISTVLVVGGVILGLGLLAGEASAAVAIAVPASMAVAKMRLSTGGF